MPEGFDERDGTWLEAISLFQCARAGNQAAALDLLATSVAPGEVVHDFVRLVSVFLRGEEGGKLDDFVDASLRVGPPPRL